MNYSKSCKKTDEENTNFQEKIFQSISEAHSCTFPYGSSRTDSISSRIQLGPDVFGYVTTHSFTPLFYLFLSFAI